MTDNPAPEDVTPNHEPNSATAERGGGSSLRMLILLLILGLGIAALAYDYLVARPALKQAQTTIEKLLDGRLQDPDGDGTVSDIEVHELLKLTPETVTNVDNGKVEMFAWQSGLPTRKYQLFVVYTGTQLPLLTAFSVNKEPDKSALPTPKNVSVRDIPADQLKNREKPKLVEATRDGAKPAKGKPAPIAGHVPTKIMAPSADTSAKHDAKKSAPSTAPPEMKAEPKTNAKAPKTETPAPKSADKKVAPAKKEPAGK